MSKVETSEENSEAAGLSREYLLSRFALLDQGIEPVQVHAVSVANPDEDFRAFSQVYDAVPAELRRQANVVLSIANGTAQILLERR